VAGHGVPPKKHGTDGGPFEVRCEYDPGASPKAIDLVFSVGVAEVRMLGIYAMEGRRLNLCWQHDGQARPTEFKTRAKPTQMLLVRERPKRCGTGRTEEASPPVGHAEHFNTGDDSYWFSAGFRNTACASSSRRWSRSWASTSTTRSRA
jgi:hypothetical protein